MNDIKLSVEGKPLYFRPEIWDNGELASNRRGRSGGGGPGFALGQHPREGEAAVGGTAGRTFRLAGSSRLRGGSTEGRRPDAEGGVARRPGWNRQEEVRYDCFIDQQRGTGQQRSPPPPVLLPATSGT